MNCSHIDWQFPFLRWRFWHFSDIRLLFSYLRFAIVWLREKMHLLSFVVQLCARFSANKLEFQQFITPPENTSSFWLFFLSQFVVVTVDNKSCGQSSDSVSFYSSLFFILIDGSPHSTYSLLCISMNQYGQSQVFCFSLQFIQLNFTVSNCNKLTAMQISM